MNPDFAEFVAALLRADTRFLIVGAHALAIHGVPRATGDIDIWIDRTPENGARVWQALLDFGAPVDALEISSSDLLRPNVVIQLGLPPRRIDILTDLSGVAFSEAWEQRSMHRVGALDVPFLGRAALIRNKQASGRLKDLADVEALGESDPRV